MGYNPTRSIWMNPNIEYLFNDDIVEYDMRDAGFSLIKQYKLLPPEKIRDLERLGKGETRHIVIGKYQGSDKEFSKRLSEKFAEIREIFVRSNQLSDERIVSVKKDAIFTIGECKRLKFGGIQFVPKNHYTSYIRFSSIQNLEIYYSDEKIDFKGISDSSVNRHRLYWVDFLRKIIRRIEEKDQIVRREIMKFVEEYKAHTLDDGYYLEFNNMSREYNPLFNYQYIIIPLIQIILHEVV